MKITKKAAVVYSLRGLKHGGWAEVTIREWNKGGSFSCQSDFGDFNYIWGSIGVQTLREFLCDLNKGYFMKKTRQGRYMEFDFDKTIEQIKTDILTVRRDEGITKQEALDSWEEVEKLYIESGESQDAFFYSISNMCPVLYELYNDGRLNDEYHPSIRERYTSGCDGFWDNMWPHFVEYWKEELKND